MPLEFNNHSWILQLKRDKNRDVENIIQCKYIHLYLWRVKTEILELIV